MEGDPVRKLSPIWILYSPIDAIYQIPIRLASPPPTTSPGRPTHPAVPSRSAAADPGRKPRRPPYAPPPAPPAAGSPPLRPLRGEAEIRAAGRSTSTPTAPARTE